MKYLLIICISILSACSQTKQKGITNEQIFITYKQPVNGYKVKVGCISDGTDWNTASFYLNDTLRFTVEGWADARLYELKHDTVIDYIPKRAMKFIYLRNHHSFFLMLILTEKMSFWLIFTNMVHTVLICMQFMSQILN